MVTVCLKSWNWHTVPVIFHCLPLILSDNRRFLFSRHQLFFLSFLLYFIVALICTPVRWASFYVYCSDFIFLEKCIQVVGLFLSWAFYCWVLTSIYVFWRSFFSAILWFSSVFFLPVSFLPVPSFCWLTFRWLLKQLVLGWELGTPSSSCVWVVETQSLESLALLSGRIVGEAGFESWSWE